MQRVSYLIPNTLRRNLFIFLLLWAAPAAQPHDIPADVAVHLFLAPRDHTLKLLVRVPLPALRDLDIRERQPGIADLPFLTHQLPDAATLWLTGFIELREDGNPLPTPRLTATQLALPGDRSFTSYEAALAHLTGPPLPDDTNAPWPQLYADFLLEYPIHSATAKFAINPRLRTLAARVLTTLRYLPPNSPERAFEFDGNPGLITLEPSWTQASARFIRLGFRHILDGTDHLLFLLCLVLPLSQIKRRIKPLVAVVTAFTAAHSLTLIAAAFDAAPSDLWFPPLVETLIAVSIVYMGLENIASPAPRPHRWFLAFAFGLIHGFGFSFALKETMQFAGDHLLTSLLAFNLGVELGQLAVLAALLPLLALLLRYVVAERIGVIVISALVVHTAWHWMLDRYTVLRKYDLNWTPELTALALRAAFLLVLLSGIIWFRRRRMPG